MPLIGEKGELSKIGRSEWAEWSSEGDLLFAQSGCLYRLRPSRRRFRPIEESEQLADFNDLAFESVKPTSAAQSWFPNGSKPGKKRKRR